MKKVLTFVLAAAMAVGMATSAMAAAAESTKINVAMSPDAANKTTPTYTVDGAAGSSWEIADLDLTMFDETNDKLTVNFTTGNSIPDDFNISASIKKGSDVVKVTVKKDDKKVEIKAIPNYAWSSTKQADYKVEIKFAAKKTSHMETKTLTVLGTVTAGSSWATVPNLEDETDVDIPYTYTNNEGNVVTTTIVKWEGNTEDVTINFTNLDEDRDDVYMEFSKMYEQGAINLYHDDEPDGYKDIQKANIDADLEFLNFPARPVFDQAGTLYLGGERDDYVYEIVSGSANALSVNGTYRADANLTLVKSSAVWDDSYSSWALRTNKLGAYVISDRELEVTTIGTGSSDSSDGNNGTGNVDNPGTGANDMVNVAVALAVVSLAAAGAVAFKRASK